MPMRRYNADDPSYARLAVAAVALEFGLPDLKLERDGRKIGMRRGLRAAGRGLSLPDGV